MIPSVPGDHPQREVEIDRQPAHESHLVRREDVDLAVQRVAAYDGVALVRLATLDGIDALQSGRLSRYDSVADARGDDAYSALSEDGEHARCVSRDINRCLHCCLTAR